MMANVLWFLLGSGLLFLFIGIWFGITFWLTPRIKHPDGKARLTGSCGDTMEIHLQFIGG
jgi:hypothetical protein